MLNPKRRNGGWINWLVFGNFTLSDKIPGINWDMACKLARGGWELDNVCKTCPKKGIWSFLKSKYHQNSNLNGGTVHCKNVKSIHSTVKLAEWFQQWLSCCWDVNLEFKPSADPHYSRYLLGFEKMVEINGINRYGLHHQLWQHHSSNRVFTQFFRPALSN